MSPKIVSKEDRLSWARNPLAVKEIRNRVRLLQDSAPPGAARAKLAQQCMDEALKLDKETAGGAAHWAKVSCQSNCSGCCHQMVEVSKDEAVLLRELAAAKPVDMKILSGQVDANSADQHYLLGMGKNDCAFLDKTGNCGIYEDRPLVCRNYHVFTPKEKCSPAPGESLESRINGKDISIAISQDLDMWMLAGFLAAGGTYPSMAKAIAGLGESEWREDIAKVFGVQ